MDLRVCTCCCKPNTPLFTTTQAFDDVVRGRAIGEVAVMTAGGGEWDKDLLFEVPVEHEEIQRLSQRYKKYVWFVCMDG